APPSAHYNDSRGAGDQRAKIYRRHLDRTRSGRFRPDSCSSPTPATGLLSRVLQSDFGAGRGTSPAAPPSPCCRSEWLSFMVIVGITCLHFWQVLSRCSTRRAPRPPTL